MAAGDDKPCTAGDCGSLFDVGAGGGADTETVAADDTTAGSGETAIGLVASGMVPGFIGVKTAENATLASGTFLSGGVAGVASAGDPEASSFAVAALESGAPVVGAANITGIGGGVVTTVVTTTVVKIGRSVMLRGSFGVVGAALFWVGSGVPVAAADTSFDTTPGFVASDVVLAKDRPVVATAGAPNIERIIASAICDGEASVAGVGAVVPSLGLRNKPIMPSNPG